MTRTKRILNIVPSKGKENDWELKQALQAGHLRQRNKLPSSVDLRASWWKINEQGTSGSCVGWAMADSVLRWHYVKKKQLPSSSLLSVRFIWMGAKETDNYHDRPTSFIEKAGTSLKSALDITRKYGCVTAEDLPFNAGKLYQGTEDELYQKAAAYKIAAYYNLVKNSRDKLLTWRRWLGYGGGPILTCIHADQAFHHAGRTKGLLTAYDKESAYLGHAIAIVGYRKNGFILRNSWGTRWGDKGYAYASDAYAKAAFTEAYGIAL